MPNNNRCVVCGVIIPEGQQVCPQCKKPTERTKVCVYCGKKLVGNERKMCSLCRSKLPLVRKFVKMCEPYRKRSV